MNAAAYVKNAYHTAEIEGLSQRDLIVMLYRGAERFLIAAKTGIANHQVEMAHQNCQKAKAVFMELMSTLNLEVGGEFAVRLRALYAYFITRIIEANLQKNAALIDEILPMIAEVRSGWEQVPDDLANVSSLPDQGRQGMVNIRT